MKLTAISLLFFLLLPLASAIEFSFDSPDSIEINESFAVKISAETSDNYDVKIVIQNNETKAILSEIYNSGWKNSYYYIKSAFPSSSEFQVRAKSFSKDTVLCVKLRKTGSSSYSEKCAEITIVNLVSSSDSPDSENDESEEENENSTISSKNKTPSVPSPEFISAQEAQDKSSSEENTKKENDNKIYLSGKAISSNEFISKEEKIRLYAVYAFTFLTIFIIIALLFRQI